MKRRLWAKVTWKLLAILIPYGSSCTEPQKVIGPSKPIYSGVEQSSPAEVRYDWIWRDRPLNLLDPDGSR